MSVPYTHPFKKFGDIAFRHLIPWRRHNCFVGAAKDKVSGKRSFFLFFEKMEKIFYRSGKDSAWEEIHDPQEYSRVRNLIRCSLISRQMASLRREMARTF